eukprot:CAMPEP_0170636886 /NCGR_PEP_ID=MMETSP0224-20130122/38083_1 /TAXON_ID=285029 /ORGANISM="Togula jolla, Strain CCCM 725" /LENGTH=234 /DNA_ID=CAMNT_0010966661 /DNA_START=370 /DNA_END=1071 /DNA_ORIENTATION=-
MDQRLTHLACFAQKDSDVATTGLYNFFIGSWDLERTLVSHNGTPMGTVEGLATFSPLTAATMEALQERSAQSASNQILDIAQGAGADASAIKWNAEYCLLYHEECKLTMTTETGTIVADAVRTYVYMFHPEHPRALQVRFWEPSSEKEHLKHFYTISSLQDSARDGNIGDGNWSIASAKASVMAGCAEHLCIQDLYRVTVALQTASTFRIDYHITGPRTNYDANTTYRRSPLSA